MRVTFHLSSMKIYSAEVTLSAQETQTIVSKLEKDGIIALCTYYIERQRLIKCFIPWLLGDKEILANFLSHVLLIL